MRKDRGHHYLTITAKGKVKDSRANDVFSITVEESLGPFSRISKEPRCPKGVDLSAATVSLDAAAADPPEVRIEVLERARKLLSPEVILRSPANPQWDALVDDATLMGGASVTATAGGYSVSPSGETVLLQWPVGCNGDVTPEKEKSIRVAEEMVQSGKLSELLGVPALSWALVQVIIRHLQA